MNKNYSGRNIKVLDDIEAIRKYPGMYIGNINNGGHLAYEVLNNSIDEVLMGYCNKIWIKFISADTILIRDNGRGIPIDQHDESFLSCELVFLRTHSGGKFNDQVYVKSGGLHGIGLSAVNALSSELKVTIVRENKVCTLNFAKGVLLNTLIVDNDSRLENGTEIIFTPDASIFESANFVINEFYAAVQYLSHLNAELTIFYSDFNGVEEVINNVDGIKGLMNTFINKDTVLKENYYLNESKGGISIELTFNWSNSSSEDQFVAFTNCILQKDGGTHVTGVRNGILKFLSSIKEINEVLDSSQNLVWNDVKRGFRLVVNCRIQSPKFDSQSKTRLVSSEVRKETENIVFNSMNYVYKNNSLVFSKLIKNVCNFIVLKRKDNKNDNNLSAFMYEGRLLDCRTNNRELAELFIAEGESAGGLIKQCRNREFQAVLSLRGKILNVEKAGIKQIMNSETLNIIASALGGSYSPEGYINLSENRYGKIIILTDADYDGLHILSLLLVLFNKHAHSLVANGRIYSVVTPLYRVQIKDKSVYFNAEEELLEFLTDNIFKSYFNKVELVEDFKRVTEVIIQILHKNYRKFNLFYVRIVEAVLHNNIWTYDSLVTNFEQFAKSMYVNNQFINCYVDNKDELVVEDYIAVDKIIINKEQFKNYIYLFVSKIKNYGKAYVDLSVLVNNTYGYGLLEYVYTKFIKILNNMVIQRFKGLGEMNVDQLYEVALDTYKRKLEKITLEDVQRATNICDILLGNDTAKRRDFIINNYNIFSFKE